MIGPELQVTSFAAGGISYGLPSAACLKTTQAIALGTRLILTRFNNQIVEGFVVLT